MPRLGCSVTRQAGQCHALVGGKAKEILAALYKQLREELPVGFRPSESLLAKTNFNKIKQINKEIEKVLLYFKKDYYK